MPICSTAGYEEKPSRHQTATRVEMKMNDVAAGFADADIIVERAFRTPTAHQGYVEPHACLVTYDEAGQSMVWCCTQSHFDVRTSIAKILGMELGKLKVIASEIGGGFGGKTVVYQSPHLLYCQRSPPGQDGNGP
ncbi:MAG: molybdopterin cofactor-binding domain-containing protein [Candidatus Azotimanducaceae bacterium WSBS_2022_MAG_OTU7]